MNMNTIKQELSKRFKNMSEADYLKFRNEMDKLYCNQHNGTVDENGNMWISHYKAESEEV